jgi:signal peptidase
MQRGWERASFRVPLDDHVLVDGQPARLVDASPAGAAVVLGSATAVGEQVRLVLGDAPEPVTVPATVTATRASDRGWVHGLAVRAEGPHHRAWLDHVLDGVAARREPAPATARAPKAPTAGTEPDARTGPTWRDRAVVAAVLAVSIPIMGCLVLVLAGSQPLIVRSGSMVPAFSVGDVVFTEPVAAASLRPGDVVTVRAVDGASDSLTHRVRRVTRDGALLRVETRGDANDLSEVWTISPGASVGRVRWSIHGLGTPATLLRGVAGQLALGVAAVAALAVGLVRGVRARASAAEATDDAAPSGPLVLQR